MDKPAAKLVLLFNRYRKKNFGIRIYLEEAEKISQLYVSDCSSHIVVYFPFV